MFSCAVFQKQSCAEGCSRGLDAYFKDNYRGKTIIVFFDSKFNIYAETKIK